MRSPGDDPQAFSTHPLHAGGAELARMLGGRLLSPAAEPAPCARLELDSRRVRQGDLFVAIRGPRFDAHEFLEDVIARGARGLLVERALGLELPKGVFAVQVEDCRRALIEMARIRRSQLKIPVLGITGTCGKTSTKETLRHLLEGSVRVHASPKSFNNDIGLPWTILNAPVDCEALVLEIGSNGPGEIAALSEIARPTHGCVTMAGRGHLERLGSVDGVAREKSALLAALPADGVAVINADDERLAIFEEAAGSRRILSFGIGDRAQLRAQGLRMRPQGVHFELWTPGGAHPQRLEIPRLGMPALRNFLAAFGLAYGAGLLPRAQELLERAASLPPLPRRLEHKLGPCGSELIDDSYNANPESLLAAASVVDRWPRLQRRLLVLGEMAELGPESEELHRELGAAMAGRFDVLLAIGEGAAPAAEGFARAGQGALSLGPGAEEGVALGAEAGGAASLMLPSLQAAQRWLMDELGEGDLVLLKGSRRAAIDELVDALVLAAVSPERSARRDDRGFPSPGAADAS